jgi:hypothetical protein
MDFTIFLDGAFWASSARRTSLAVGEPGSSSPTLTGNMLGPPGAVPSLAGC